MIWLLFSFISFVLTSLWIILITGGTRDLPRTIYHRNIYIALTLVIVGGLSLFYLIISYLLDKHKIIKIINSDFNYTWIVSGAFVLFVTQLFMNLAFSFANDEKISGGVVHAIINMNMFIVLIASVFIYNANINIGSIISIFIAGLSIVSLTYFTIYPFHKINVPKKYKYTIQK
tara:strand:- start:63 stop:584 length:522 start_codon:yes stop_codon:yes gene_type:complete